MLSLVLFPVPSGYSSSSHLKKQVGYVINPEFIIEALDVVAYLPFWILYVSFWWLFFKNRIFMEEHSK